MLADDVRDGLILAPWTEALRLIAGRPVRLRMLVPPFAAAGIGALRVVRVREAELELELFLGYEGYARLVSPAR